MNTVRAFIAVEIDPQTKQKISTLVSLLKASNAGVKWVTEDQMHFTLKFLGNIAENKIQEISNTLSIISNNFNSFAINFSKIGAFPNINYPRVIWLGIDKGVESLKILSEEIENALEKLGFQKENRKYKPHLTLGRVKSDKNILNLTNLIRETNFNPENNIQINKLTLFQSTINPKGAIYTPLATCLFAL